MKVGSSFSSGFLGQLGAAGIPALKAGCRLASARRLEYSSMSSYHSLPCAREPEAIHQFDSSGLGVLDGSGLAVAARKQSRNRNQQNRAHGRCGEAPPKADPANAEPRKNPSADHGPDQSQNHVDDASEAASSRQVPRKPSRQQTNDDPRDPALHPNTNDYGVRPRVPCLRAFPS